MNLEEIKARAEKVELTMERLTRRGKKNKTWVLINKSCSKADGSFCPHANICSHVENRTCPYLDALDRLAAYEDTGLTPSDIVEMISEVERLKAELETPPPMWLSRARRCKRASGYISQAQR